MLKASVDAALDTGTVKSSSLERFTLGATVQPKAIAYLTEGQPYLKALLSLGRLARRFGIELRQSHTRLDRVTPLRAGRHAHARQFRRMRRELKKLRIYLDRVYRDILRKIAGNLDLEASFARLLGLAERLLAHKPKDRHKASTRCMTRSRVHLEGKARTPDEFGAKVGIAPTNREGRVLAPVAFENNPYDRHTVNRTEAQAVEIGGVDPERI